MLGQAGKYRPVRRCWDPARAGFRILLAWWAMGQVWAQMPDASAMVRPGMILTSVENRGKEIFGQRCTGCHLPLPKRASSIGPALTKIFSGPEAVDERAIRRFILNGSKLMPPFRYSLPPRDLDAVVAFLKAVQQ
jgi:mono/diheme cytochrome c family protein